MVLACLLAYFEKLFMGLVSYFQTRRLGPPYTICNNSKVLIVTGSFYPRLQFSTGLVNKHDPDKHRDPRIVWKYTG